MDKTEVVCGIRPLKQVLLYCTEGSTYFADLIFERLRSQGIDVEKGRMIRKHFDDGECYYRVAMDGRYDLFGKDIIYVGSLLNDIDFMEVYRVGSAMAGYGTRQRIFVIPYLGYSTMERAVLPGEVVTCKSNLRMLSKIPSTGLGNCFLLMDLHVSGILHYFEGPCVRFELYGQRALTEGIRQHIDQIGAAPGTYMFASADLGRPKWVASFATAFSTDIAFVRKTRDPHGAKTEVHEVIGTVAGKHVIIYDDMTRSAGTIIQAANAYLQHGALSVAAAISHFAPVSEAIVRKVIDSPLTRLITTNSHPCSQSPLIASSPKFIVVDVAPIFADVIVTGLKTANVPTAGYSPMAMLGTAFIPPASSPVGGDEPCD